MNTVTVRRASLDDTPAVVELLRAHEASLGVPAETDESEIEHWWSRIELERDTWLLKEDDRLVATAWMLRDDVRCHATGAVAPDRRDLLPQLLELLEQSAGTVALHFGVYRRDAETVALLESRGYRPVRRYYQMVIELDNAPPPPQWPDGIRAGRFRAEDARPFYDAMMEAFAGEWGFSTVPFEEWVPLRVEGQDTSLYLLAYDGDEAVGALRGIPEFRGMGFVGMLGVRPAWQGRGIGRALLLNALGEFHRRGIRRVGLGVDSENPAATRIYERVGMHVEVEEIVYEKGLG